MRAFLEEFCRAASEAVIALYQDARAALGTTKGLAVALLLLWALIFGADAAREDLKAIGWATVGRLLGLPAGEP